MRQITLNSILDMILTTIALALGVCNLYGFSSGDHLIHWTIDLILMSLVFVAVFALRIRRTKLQNQIED